MSSDAKRSSHDHPFRALQKWMNHNSPSGSIIPSARNPTQPGRTGDEPTPSAYSMADLLQHTKGEKSKIKQTHYWIEFTNALQALETKIEVLPPMKTTVSDLLVCTRDVQIGKQNQPEYDRLASDLTGLVRALRANLPSSKPRWIPYSIENAARGKSSSTNEQVAHIKQQQDYSEAPTLNYEMDILGCYQRIEGIFRQLQNDISLSVWDVAGENMIDTCLANLNPVHDAWYNAAPSAGMLRRGCTPNTRVNILKEAIEWAGNPDAAKIYWMSGAMGTGKTTIAYSLCEQLEESKQLGACFFCSRIFPECRKVNLVIPTIAYQLARFSNPYRNELFKVLDNDPSLAKIRIPIQFEKLLVGPLLKVKGAIPTNTTIVIDGLDECSNIQGTQLVLDLLFRHAKALPVKFFLTNQPEPDILSRIPSAKDANRFIVHLRDIERSLVQADIQTILAQELAPTAASTDDIEQLSSRAGRLFIYAATVARYVEPHRGAVDHRARLATILTTSTNVKGDDYQRLNELYLTILSQAQQGTQGNTGRTQRLLLWAVIRAQEPLTIPTLAELTGIDKGEDVELVLLSLHSILRVSTDIGVVSILHASFAEFMFNAKRSKGLYGDAAEQDTYMATRCFEIMKKSLRFNICNLETSSRLDRDVPDLQSRVNKDVSSGLFYACRYWGNHLYGAKHSNGLTDMLHEFLRHQLLFWMEVLNLKGQIGSAAFILLVAFEYLPVEGELSILRSVVQEFRKFVTAYATSPAAQSTPHIYISALPLMSTQSFMRKTYMPRMKGHLQIHGTAVKDRQNTALAIWATGSSLSKLTLSTDGRRVASGQSDGTIMIWDASGGRRLLSPLKKHNGRVYALVFSQDGTKIASGSYDSTICIWNAYNGEASPGLFEGHTAPITGLVFLPDGARLISCSKDSTIRIWDSLTGVQVGLTLRDHGACVMSIRLLSNGQLVSSSDDHTVHVWDFGFGKSVARSLAADSDQVECVAFSPDDKYIASSSHHCIIRVWSFEQGKMRLNLLLAHTDVISCLEFSPDGKKIASGAHDRTIRVWSAETGALIGGPFEQESIVHAVIFLRDGTQIISGSEEGTMCIWDANHRTTGETTGSIGHTGSILSAILSPDGNRVISGSKDHTICVWDTHEGSLILGPLTGHTDWVRSVACTPDGTCIVSGSHDCTIRIWDAYTGKLLADPFTRHTDGVMAVAVSPDGTLIASGSSDGSVKIWSLRSGVEVVGFPKYHTDWVHSVEFSPNGSYLASASDDSKVCIWDVSTGSLIRRLEQHTGGVTCARFSPNGSKLITCSRDKTLLLWDVDTGAVLSDPWKGHNSPVWAASFTPNGTKVVSGAADGEIRVWDAGNRRWPSVALRGHTDLVRSVAFTPDSKHMVSASGDRTIRLWDLVSDDDTQSQGIGSWAADEDGWVKDSESRLVVWLPPDLKRIISPPCSLITSPKGTVRLNSSNCIYGDRWAECYTISSGSNPSNPQLPHPNDRLR